MKTDLRRPDVLLSAITRREFLHVGGAAAALAAFPGCKPEFHPGGEHPDGVRPPSGPESFARASCDLCASGCGVTVRIVGGRAAGVAGNAAHPQNRGALCPRGAASLQHLYDLDRVVGPARRKAGRLERVSWDEALAELAERVAAGGVVIVDGLRGVEADLADRFARAAGARRVPADPLREAARAVVGPVVWRPWEAALAMFFGCEFAEDAPDLMASLRSLSRRRTTSGRTVHVGPRFSTSAALADEFVAVKPGTEAVLALGMGHVLLGSGRGVDVAPAYRGLADRFAPSEAARITGVPAETIVRLARDFAATVPQVAIGWRGVFDAAGEDGLAAVHALNHLVGGAEAKGSLAASPLADWPPLVAPPEPEGSGAARVVIALHGNPAYAAPDRFPAAEFRVAVGPLLDETAALADLVLPTPTFFERPSVEVLSAGRDVAASGPAVPPLHDTRCAGDILLGVAHRVPALRAALPWETFEEAARERLFGVFLAQKGSPREDKWEKFLERIEGSGVWTDDAPPATTPAPRTGPARWPERFQPPAFAGRGAALVTFAPIALGTGEGASLPWLQEIAGWPHGFGWDSWIEIHPRHGFATGERVRVRSPHGEIHTRVVATPACPSDVVAMPLGQGHAASGRWAAGRGADPRRLGRNVRVEITRV